MVIIFLKRPEFLTYLKLSFFYERLWDRYLFVVNGQYMIFNNPSYSGPHPSYVGRGPSYDGQKGHHMMDPVQYVMDGVHHIMDTIFRKIP